ncbi:MAG: hypothetical protein CM15mP92_1990 [Halieaceae bacterium]|nr:MAG: hypothetical protein CM15mP92_1990 [Halieaceae bacterium]
MTMGLRSSMASGGGARGDHDRIAASHHFAPLSRNQAHR